MRQCIFPTGLHSPDVCAFSVNCGLASDNWQLHICCCCSKCFYILPINKFIEMDVRSQSISFYDESKKWLFKAHRKRLFLFARIFSYFVRSIFSSIRSFKFEFKFKFALKCHCIVIILIETWLKNTYIKLPPDCRTKKSTISKQREFFVWVELRAKIEISK